MALKLLVVPDRMIRIDRVTFAEDFFRVIRGPGTFEVTRDADGLLHAKKMTDEALFHQAMDLPIPGDVPLCQIIDKEVAWGAATFLEEKEEDTSDEDEE